MLLKEELGLVELNDALSCFQVDLDISVEVCSALLDRVGLIEGFLRGIGDGWSRVEVGHGYDGDERRQ